MAQDSKIEWTDHTFNPWVGCTNVSPGCDHCYAESWSKRSGLVKWGNNPRRRTSEAYWRSPLKWQAGAASFEARHGRRQRVFCASLADVFDNKADKVWRRDLFDLIEATPALDWLLLTKRFDQRWPVLAKIPAAIRFISYEPAIGPVRLPPKGLRPDWLISGGESGHGARPMNPQWARDVIADCEMFGIAAFHKQWGAFRNNPLCFEQGLSAKEAEVRDAHGKGGGLLDGRLYRRFPESRGLSTVAA
jgi:protein gp37